jgi:hypothetical protein
MERKVPYADNRLRLIGHRGGPGLVEFGVMSSPAVGPVRVAFYFLLFLSVSILIYGMVQTEIHADPRVPTQEQNQEGR